MVSVVIPAAGLSKRMLADRNKQYMMLGGRPILAHTIEKFEQIDAVREIIVVAAPDEVDFCREKVVNRFECKKVKAVVPGGATRQHSVFNGLQQTDPQAEVVLVHDGVRPFVRTEMLEAFIRQLSVHQALVMAVPEKNSIARINGGLIAERIRREDVWEMQTPQGFQRELLVRAFETHQDRLDEFTDDASLVSATGADVSIFTGDYLNIKITTPEDLLLGEAILEMMR